MDIIFNTPYVLRVLVSLCIILLVNKLIKQLSLAVLTGTLVLAVWSGHSPESIAIITWERVSSIGNLLLMCVIFQVIWLSSQMSETGVMKDLVDSIRTRISRRTAMALLPAVIGLLPMPGGAVFSAPLVDDCDSRGDVDGLMKTRINYWFRHIWEYWWPLYPGVILAVEITSLPITVFSLLQMPLSLLSIAGGYLFLLKKVKTGDDPGSRENRAPVMRIMKLIMPIILVVCCFLVIRFAAPGIMKISTYLPMMCGILAAQLALQVMRPLPWQSWKKILFTKNTLLLALLVALIRVYGAFIEAKLPGGGLLMDQVRNELASAGIPVVLLFMVIPFISGLATGIAIGFVGASFPIVMTLVAGTSHDLWAVTVLAYASGYMGMMLSPVHVCLVVTNQYFRTSLARSLAGLIRPALVVLAGSVVLYAAIMLCNR